MILPKENNRSWNKVMWKYMNRLGRCIDRARNESGSLDKQLIQMAVYGTNMYTPEEQKIDADRIAQLMSGLHK